MQGDAIDGSHLEYRYSIADAGSATETKWGRRVGAFTGDDYTLAKSEAALYAMRGPEYKRKYEAWKKLAQIKENLQKQRESAARRGQ